MLGAIAAKTDRIGLATGVTCPTVRYLPAIIAQAAATLSVVSAGRVTLGIGAGERLNEHVVGRGFPDARVRHEMLREAVEIRLLWRGYRSYEGRHLQLSDARVFDLPDELPVIAIAASGEASARVAAELGDGLFATEPKKEIIARYGGVGGDGPRYAEVPMAWAPDEHTAVAVALETSRWAVTWWKVMSELPNPVNFAAASAIVREDDIRGQFACGPDVSRYVEVAQQFVDAGFDHLVMQNAGPDPDGFIDFFQRELEPTICQLVPQGAAA
ncbi:MAG: class F420-dependent oxidoreductase [Mycobacterium sp.]|nr:class F420-dependent oxidoreductase [Mycobacterium sp.]MDT5074939.1 hypothetical protein [Mycobacterium sp.]